MVWVTCPSHWQTPGVPPHLRVGCTTVSFMLSGVSGPRAGLASAPPVMSSSLGTDVQLDWEFLLNGLLQQNQEWASGPSSLSTASGVNKMPLSLLERWGMRCPCFFVFQG